MNMSAHPWVYCRTILSRELERGSRMLRDSPAVRVVSQGGGMNEGIHDTQAGSL